MPIVTYHARDAQGQVWMTPHLTLDEALDLAAADLARGSTPVALEINGRRFDTPLILALLDARQPPPARP